MRTIRIDLKNTRNCKRPLNSERKLQPFFGVVELEFTRGTNPSITIKMIDLNDDYVAQSFSTEDCYEPLMIREWLANVETLKGSILDIGASTGLYSLLAAAMYKGQRIHAFEPFPRAVSRLVNNKSINIFPKIHIHPFAIGAEAGTTDFFIRSFEGPITTGGTLITGKSEMTIAVSVKVLTDILSLDEPIALIKIDVEGHELAVLKNIAPQIQRWTPVIFFEALSVAALQELMEFFHSLNYEVYCLNEEADLVEALPAVITSLLDRNFIAKAL